MVSEIDFIQCYSHRGVGLQSKAWDDTISLNAKTNLEHTVPITKNKMLTTWDVRLILFEVMVVQVLVYG